MTVRLASHFFQVDPGVATEYHRLIGATREGAGSGELSPLFMSVPAMILLTEAADSARRRGDGASVPVSQTISQVRPLRNGDQLTVDGNLTHEDGVTTVQCDIWRGADPVGHVEVVFLRLTEREVQPPSTSPPGPRGRPERTSTLVVSRSDLSDYAGVTGDWSPIHVDAEAAHAAGFETAVVHGSFAAALAAQRAIDATASAISPTMEIRSRLRAPMFPDHPAQVELSRLDGEAPAFGLIQGGVVVLDGEIDL